jgi:eukaryotic-like serine/threonine-protein kinase
MFDQQEDRLDQQVDEYRLVRKLGRGGFGTVYLAEHVCEHTQVAVKVFNIRLTKGEDFKDFINEASAMRLRHPHIVSLHDFGIRRDDLPFLVMEYASGGTLRDRHPKGEPVPLLTVVSYVDQLASALQYAHDHRVIHRDVKPENILVRADGTLLVSDFGIAKLLEQNVLMSAQTQVGTPVYMAPEQSRGYPCFASDQYALAVVVYEWICGVRPFQGTVFGLALQHMNTPPPRLRGYLPGLSEEVEHVVLKALAKVPEDRFESIQKFADALREAVQSSASTIVVSQLIETRKTVSLIAPGQVSQPVSGPLQNSTSHSTSKPRPSRGFSWLVGASLGLLLLLIVLLVTIVLIVPVQRRPSSTPATSTPVTPKHPNQVVQQRWTFSTGNGFYEVSSPMVVYGMLYVGSGDKTYALDANTGQQKWVSPVNSVYLYAVNGILYICSGNSSDNRVTDVYALDAGTGQQKWSFISSDFVRVSAVVKDTVYISTQNTSVYALDANTGQQKWTFPAGGSTIVVNGVVYISSVDGNVYAVDAGTGQQKWVFPARGQLSVVDGVLYVDSDLYDGDIYAVDADTGQQRWVFSAGGQGIVGSSLTVVNGVLYYGALDHKVYAINANTGQQKWTFLTGDRVFSSPTVVDGVLYVGSQDHRVYAIDANTGQQRWVFKTGWLVDTSPVVINGVVYVGCSDRKVYAIEASTGQQEWAFETGDWIDMSPTVVNGVLYIGSHDGKIYALTLPVS